MEYDWTGVRTRRLLLLKWTSVSLVLACLPFTLLIWL
jgi:hypothetical protein